jgi:hypothetical protein
MPYFKYTHSIRMAEAAAFKDRYTSRGLAASSANFPSFKHPMEESFSDNTDGLFSQADLRSDIDLSELVGLAKSHAFSEELILYDISVNITKYVDVKLVPGEVYPIILDRNFVLPDMFTNCDFSSKASLLCISMAGVQCMSCIDHAPLDYQVEFPETNQVINYGCGAYSDAEVFTDEMVTNDSTNWQMMSGSGIYPVGYTPVVINEDSIVVCTLKTLTDYECNLKLRIKLRLSLPVKW